MAKEYVIPDSVVACLTINAAPSQDDRMQGDPNFLQLANRLRAICQPPRNATIFFNRWALQPIYASSDGLATGCSWTGADEGQGAGEVVLEPEGQEDARIRVGIKLVIAKDGRVAWLTVEYTPTTMDLGRNIHPASFVNPATGEDVAYPSSEWGAMSRTFRLGFDFLEEVAGGHLFDADTKLAIERGDFHLVRVQWAAAKRVSAVARFLQLLTVVYDQTIARGWGIISNATHLGLEFEPFIDRETHRLTGVLFRKRHGTKLVFSVSVYDKQARLNQMHQDLGGLTEEQKVTVKESVREDITAHSEGILIIVHKARRKLDAWGDEGLKFFDFLSPEVFLREEPKPTVWWLQRAVFILSHYRQHGKFQRFSFGVWLVPYVEEDVLHFDAIAGSRRRGFIGCLGCATRWPSHGALTAP
jgi:hypothetical protein